LGRQEFNNIEYFNSLTEIKRNSCIFDILDKNKELKGELHKSRKNNGTLRSKVNKCQKETSDLRIDKLELINKIEKLERARDQDKRYMNQQESEIQNLHKQLRNQGSNSGEDLEKETLRETLERVIEVKMKYENIIKALVDNPKIKPYVARVLEKK
jgi:chromosome segregation ATPase